MKRSAMASRTTWGDSEGEGEIVAPGGSQAPSTPINGRVP